MAEREGFEPPIRLPVCRISSAVRSTTLPPLQHIDLYRFSYLLPSVQCAIATEFATQFLILHL